MKGLKEKVKNRRSEPKVRGLELDENFELRIWGDSNVLGVKPKFNSDLDSY